MFSGTFEWGAQWFRELYEVGQAPNEYDIKSFSLPSWANPSLYPLGRDSPAIKQVEALLPQDQFMERFGGVPAPPRDALFPEFRPELHISQVMMIEGMPVYLFVDPGQYVYCVLFVQFVNGEVWVLNEVYAHQWTHEQVVNECLMKEEWKGVTPYGHVIDVAGRQAHQGQSNAVRAWADSTTLNFSSQSVPLETSIDRLRSVMLTNPTTKRPRLRIHPKCKGLIAELGGGPSPVPGGGRWKQRAGVPEHKNDHACKALAYGLVKHFGAIRPESTRSFVGVSYMRDHGRA